MASGHAMFHLCFFVGSMIAIDVRVDKESLTKLKDKDFEHDITSLIMLVRAVHLFVFITQVIQVWLEGKGMTILSQFFRVFQIFLYQGTILYEQQQLLTYKES